MISPPNQHRAPSAQVEERLRRDLERVTIARPAAAHVLAIIDNPNTSAPQVADSIEHDPGFAAQILRLANSAYYGMSGRVRNTVYAVTVLGFSAVRSLAALSAAGLDDARRPKPPGFWVHAAATAAGCAAVAGHFGLVVGDAFAAGLLHDLGLALLHGFDPEGHQELIDLHGDDGAALTEAEIARYGIGHPEAASSVLKRWNFPADFIAAIAEHHLSTPATTPLSAVVRIGEVLAGARESTATELLPEHATLLREAGLAEESWDELLGATGQRTAEILASLPVGS